MIKDIEIMFGPGYDLEQLAKWSSKEACEKTYEKYPFKTDVDFDYFVNIIEAVCDNIQKLNCIIPLSVTKEVLTLLLWHYVDFEMYVNEEARND